MDDEIVFGGKTSRHPVRRPGGGAMPDTLGVRARSLAAASAAVLEGDKRILVAGTVRRPGLAPHGGIGLVRLGL